MSKYSKRFTYGIESRDLWANYFVATDEMEIVECVSDISDMIDDRIYNELLEDFRYEAREDGYLKDVTIETDDYTLDFVLIKVDMSFDHAFGTKYQHQYEVHEMDIRDHEGNYARLNRDERQALMDNYGERAEQIANGVRNG